MDWDCTLSILALLVFDTIFGDHLVTPRIRTSLMEQPFILRPDWKRPISGRSICPLSIGNSAQAFSREWRDKIADIHCYIVTSRCCVSLQSLVCICVYPSHSITWGIHETVLQSIIKHFQAFSSTKDRERERETRSLTQFMPATNNIAPNTAEERVFAIFVVLLGLAVFSSFVTWSNGSNSPRLATHCWRSFSVVYICNLDSFSTV